MEMPIAETWTSRLMNTKTYFLWRKTRKTREPGRDLKTW